MMMASDVSVDVTAASSLLIKTEAGSETLAIAAIPR